MELIRLPMIGTVDAWRSEARRLARVGVPPEAVLWRVGEGEGDLFAGGAAAPGQGREIRVSKAALSTIESALSHSDPERFALAYDAVLRLSSGALRSHDRTDPALGRLIRHAKAVHRDIHKMHAFVRFRELPSDGSRRRFAAWFEPEHPCVEAATPFFAKRFGDMDWVIATPTLTATFEGGRLSYAVTEARPDGGQDATEDLWRTYFSSIFNPARLHIRAMQSEMPKKYWKNLPEADLIPELIRTADARAAEMRAKMPTPEPARRVAVARTMLASDAPMPEGLGAARAEAANCTRCALHECATQVVWGEGPPDARLMVVGEQPGDQEDLRGRPFVGPSGELFDRLSAEVGFDRRTAYVTNAVKHFKFTMRGKRRIHSKPDAGEIDRCAWWLGVERRLVAPKVILGLGATAARAVTGDGTGVMKRRGRVETLPDGTLFLPSIHPAHALRAPSEVQRQELCGMLASDIAEAARLAA